jgi:DNA-directed RNA polymerase subunit M/transcription elongation factor TFIIS
MDLKKRKCHRISEKNAKNFYQNRSSKLCTSLSCLRARDIEKEYVLAMQQLMSDENVKTQMDRINTGEIGWKHSSIFNDVTDVNEMRDYIQKPLEVEEGVITCRCGSKRVFSYQKQTRGCDESSTTFAQCAQCGQQWTYSG